jgi:outer membrane protein TolC
MRRAFPLWYALVLLVPGGSRASTETLAWETCVTEALAHNPDLQRARLDAAAAADRRNAAFGGFLPRLGADLGASDSATNRRLWFKDMNAWWTANVSASQSLFSGFATVADAVRASAAARRAGIAAHQAEADLRQRLRRAFVDVLYGQANVEVQAAIAKRSKGNAELVRLRYEGGREDKGSAMRAEAVARQAAFEETRSRRALTLARRRLAQAMGRDVVAAFTVTGDWAVAPPPAAPDLDTMAATLPEVTEAEASLTQARADAWSAASSFLPDVSANASVSRSDPRFLPADGKAWSAGVSASWNLFNGGRDVFGFAAARANRASAEAALAGARRDARTSLESAWVEWQDADESLAVNRQFLEAANARAEIGRAQYANGRLGFQEWIQIEDEVVSAERNEVSARRDALNAEADWLRALGQGFAR